MLEALIENVFNRLQGGLRLGQMKPGMLLASDSVQALCSTDVDALSSV